MKRPQPIIRIALWALPVVLLGWIVNQNVVLFGSATYRCTADRCNAQIRNVAPKQLDVVTGTMKGSKERYRTFTVNPLTFETQLYRVMKQATVRVEYWNGEPGKRLTLNVSGAIGTEPKSFILGDSYAALSTLESGWNATKSGEITLFQKRDPGVPQYASVEEFLDTIPDRKDVADYHVDLSSRKKIAGYTPSDGPRTFAVSIRGSHTFMTYVGAGEDLDVSFNIRNSNRNPGEDPVTITVYRGEDTVLRKAIGDNGTGKGDGKPSPAFDVSVHLDAPGEGTYRIDVTTNSGDQFIRSITTSQRYFTVSNAIYPAGSKEYHVMGQVESEPLVLYMKGTYLTARTSHKTMLQTITVGGQKLDLADTQTDYSIEVPASDDLVQVVVPNRDVFLTTDGTFALSRDAYFSTQMENVVPLHKAGDLTALSYVIARYVPVTRHGAWAVAERTIAALPAGRTLRFSIHSDPSITDGDGTLRVKSLEVKLTGRSLGFSDAVKGLKRIVGKD